MDETPKTRYSGFQRNPTPRIMSRRKSLFADMEPESSPIKPKSLNTSEPLIEQDLDGIEFLEMHDQSVEDVLKNSSFLNSSETPIKKDKNHKENGHKSLEKVPSIDQELPTLLNSMSLKKSKSKNSDDKENSMMSAKRQMIFSPRKEEPALKIKKVDDKTKKEDDATKKVSPIATTNFYSAKNTTVPTPKIQLLEPKKTSRITKRRKTISKSKPHLKPTSIENILKTINSDKLRTKILAHREQKRKLEEVHKILLESQNPIAMAVPLRIEKDKNVTCDFSDVEECSIEEVEVEFVDEMEMEKSPEVSEPVQEVEVPEPVQELEVPEPNPEVQTKRKFFKSKDRTTKEVNVLEGLKIEVAGSGKMCLKTPKAKKVVRKRKYVKKSESKFKDEQSAVNNIIENLDITVESHPTEPPFVPFRDRLPYKTNDPETIEKQNILMTFLESNNICTEENFIIFIAEPEKYADKANEIISKISSDLEMEDANEFRKRIPYNTTDPQIIEQQKTLLEFLISNGICTEENFEIFIADYDNRKNEAAEVMNQFVASESTDGSELSSNVEMEGVEILPPLNQEKEQKLYPLFYADKAKEAYKKLSFETSRKIRQFNGGFGANQYQIDAGQKEFGAKQCKDCGLIYTVHEPEEEKLHREYHDNLYILRFKGWIDEVVVGRFPEWSPDGRIIKLTHNDPIKRRQRIHEVLRVVVDKELGFSSYILPQEYVAYFAISKNKIIGMCLVQPLEKAYKYLCIDGVDCCSLESYDVKCGISRIWISPFYRRLKVGKKLINAVQSNTFLGNKLSMTDIAFSAPTEDGKRFAKSVSQKEDFFVYQ